MLKVFIMLLIWMFFGKDEWSYLVEVFLNFWWFFWKFLVNNVWKIVLIGIVIL